MKTLNFKTNINCDGCIATVTPFFEKESRINKWNVDTSTKDKILTIETENLSEEEVKSLIEKAGFKVKE